MHFFCCSACWAALRSVLPGGWISPEVEFLLEGQQQFLEEYKDIQANITIPAAFWDPRQWKAARAGR